MCPHSQPHSCPSLDVRPLGSNSVRSTKIAGDANSCAPLLFFSGIRADSFPGRRRPRESLSQWCSRCQKRVQIPLHSFLSSDPPMTCCTLAQIPPEIGGCLLARNLAFDFMSLRKFSRGITDKLTAKT